MKSRVFNNIVMLWYATVSIFFYSVEAASNKRFAQASVGTSFFLDALLHDDSATVKKYYEGDPALYKKELRFTNKIFNSLICTGALESFKFYIDQQEDEVIISLATQKKVVEFLQLSPRFYTVISDRLDTLYYKNSLLQEAQEIENKAREKARKSPVALFSKPLDFIIDSSCVSMVSEHGFL